MRALIIIIFFINRSIIVIYVKCYINRGSDFRSYCPALILRCWRSHSCPPAVVSWHLSKDQRNSTACPLSLICSSISLTLARTWETSHAFRWSAVIRWSTSRSDHVKSRSQTCWLKLLLPPGMGRFEGAIGKRSNGEPVLLRLSVRE